MFKVILLLPCISGVLGGVKLANSKLMLNNPLVGTRGVQPKTEIMLDGSGLFPVETV